MKDYYGRREKLSFKLDVAGYGMADEELAHVTCHFDTLLVGIQSAN